MLEDIGTFIENFILGYVIQENILKELLFDASGVANPMPL